MKLTTSSLRVLGGLAAIATTRATLTMTKVGGYASRNEGEGPLEIVVVKPSTNVSALCNTTRYIWHTAVSCAWYPSIDRKMTQPFGRVSRQREDGVNAEQRVY